MKKVLIIDDSTSWQMFLKKKIEELGYEVEVAEDGLEGLNKFFEFLPDIIISDYVMPKMNGVHLCRFIRSYSSFSKVGILILTGANESINEFWAKKSGANMFLRKDIESEILVEKIDDFIKNNNFSIEWTREFYKFRVNPFSELVDILEETLKMEVLKSTVLDLVDKVSDEEYIINNLYDLFKEFFLFEGLHIMLLSANSGRVYSFPEKNRYSSNSIKSFLFSNLIKPLTPTKWEYIGIFDESNNDMPRDFLIFNITNNNNDLGIIAFENIENKNNIIYYMNFLNEAISILFKTLNSFIDFRTASERDGLTNLYNKKVITEKLNDLLISFKRKKFDLSIAMLDIDDFKQINDNFGHVVGDEVLKIFSNLLNSEMRENDFVGRYGGEEFLVIMPGTNCQEAKVALERALKKVREYDWKKIGIIKPITFSGGVCCEYKGKSLTEFIDNADTALYLAKKLGKNRIITEEELK
ncbi:diguanylate cyclase [Marinitoga sp. 38H-ov]|uniref:GGDEF domain-containing response regulator n=1 Tax=Marinitoga sp. 38H-ov TaxID=1755814 RepID=UPI0013EA1A0E|nr:diguanylate cyclase [Marinitoga sp. 38H-ov]KAF2956217.1 diguanylate cyclase response regulator [Marinitoga sp. 38H-ov]